MRKSEERSITIQVLERAFGLLDMLASHPDPVSLKQISEQTGLHPSTAHRILNDLTIGRYVDRPEAGSYRLGMRLLELGNLVKARLDVRDAALGPMRELHKLTHQPVNLSMRQGDEIVYIERTYSERSGMQVVRAIGGRAPLHLTSVGKLFLAHDDAPRVRAYATRTGLAGHTRNSITELHSSNASWRGSPVRHGTRRRGTGTRRALHGGQYPRRPGQAGRRAVDLGTGRSAGGELARAAQGNRRADFGDARPPRSLTEGAARGETSPATSGSATVTRVGVAPGPPPRAWRGTGSRRPSGARARHRRCENTCRRNRGTP